MLDIELEERLSQAIQLLKSMLENPDDILLQKIVAEFIRENE